MTHPAGNRFTQLLTASLCCFLLSSSLSAEELDSQQRDFFEKKIRPVLVTKCYKCHSAETKEPKGGLLLDTREGIRRGGESGHGVVPGKLDESLIIPAMKHESFEMPPNEQLPDSVIADFEKWVAMGAPDPREGKSAPIRRVIDFAKARQFWSFQPLSHPKVPQVKQTAWPQTDIDRFVLAKLEARNIGPVAVAEPEVLVRRLYFDLIGLPPTPEQMAEFLSDPSPKAYETLVDTLLDSPHFGERWGRHWLDVVRYGESTGMERNFTYPHAWRFRDYVIQSFNEDKPFNQFMTEQIAGDLLPANSKEQRIEQHVATGLLAMGPKSLNERNREQFLMDIVDEQIDVTTRAFLGLTVSCARCHDHKFDPVPQQEYYALAGIFRSTNTHYGTSGDAGNRQAGSLLKVAANETTILAARNTGRNKGNGQNVARLRNQLKQLKIRQAAFEKRSQNASTKRQIDKLKIQISRVEKVLKTTEQKTAASKPTTADDAVTVMGVLDNSTAADTQLRIRGEADDRGKTIPRGFLTIASLTESPSIPDSGSGRLEYAQWLTQADNPLTARVAVNRCWQHLFGRGIVATVNNFGANGERPTHPELLDYLARQFQENGWSIKSTIREMVLSKTYQLSSAGSLQAEKIDPENLLCWRANQRRLEVEAVRDAILSASGNLDLTPGEKSIVATIGDGNVGRTLRTDQFEISGKRQKRSVYLPIVRGAVPEMLKVFDFPEPSIIAGQREVTTVPTQALYLMNSPFILEQSGQFANRLLQEVPDDTAARIALAYQLAFNREVTEAEQSQATTFLKELQTDMPGEKNESKVWATFCQILFASAEFRYLQ